MEVILLEKIGNLGEFGSKVSVRDGYARNFLIPQRKALRATKTNEEYFDSIKADLEAQRDAKKAEAKKVVEKVDGETFKLIRPASEDGRLYGSIHRREIATELSEKSGLEVDRKAVMIEKPIKNTGVYEVDIAPHPEVETKILLVVALSESEAEEALKEYKAESEETEVENTPNAPEENTASKE